jgi:hypothetical protein
MAYFESPCSSPSLVWPEAPAHEDASSRRIPLVRSVVPRMMKSAVSWVSFSAPRAYWLCICILNGTRSSWSLSKRMVAGSVVDRCRFASHSAIASYVQCRK